MQRHIDNWITQLTTAAPADNSPLALPAEALARLDFAGGGEYLLTVVGSLNPLEQTVVERVLISAAGQERGQDGTAEQAWPQGAFVFCALTASQLASFEKPRQVVNINAPGVYEFNPRDSGLLYIRHYGGDITINIDLPPPGQVLGVEFDIAGYGHPGTILLHANGEFSGAFVSGVNPSIISGTFVIDGSDTVITDLNGWFAGRLVVEEFASFNVYMQIAS